MARRCISKTEEIALFVVPDEEILGVGLRVGQVDLRHLCHIVNTFVPRYLMPDVCGAEKSVNLLLVYVSALLANTRLADSGQRRREPR